MKLEKNSEITIEINPYCEIHQKIKITQTVELIDFQ